MKNNKFLSNINNKNSQFLLQKISNLDGNFISGLTQADGSFNINFRKGKKVKLWIGPRFSITQQKKDIFLLECIKEYFSTGFIVKNRKDSTIVYEVNNLKDLVNIIIPHFYKYPLRSDKNNSFIIFSHITKKVYNKEHYNIEELYKIINLVFYMNPFTKRKISKNEYLRYLNSNDINLIKNENLYLQEYNKIIKSSKFDKIHINFIKGLFQGDGCISISYTLKGKISFNFSIVQDIHNYKVLEELKEFFNCGSIAKIRRNAAVYYVTNIQDLKNNIFPYFFINDSSYGDVFTLKKEQLIKVKTILIMYENGKSNINKYYDINKYRNLFLKLVNIGYNMNKARKLSKEEYLKKLKI